MATESDHRERPPYVLKAILKGDRAALSRYGTNGNNSPLRTRTKLSDIEREARRIERNEKRRVQRQQWKHVQMAIFWSLFLKDAQEELRAVEREEAIERTLELYRRRSWAHVVRRDAKAHAESLNGLDE